jgi:sugar transferase EpsL
VWGGMRGVAQAAIAKAGWRVNGWWRRSGKRWCDCVLASIGLIILAPMLVLTGLAIRLAMGPPIIFRQQRAGLKGRPFILYKFRTMTDARDAQGNLRPDQERLSCLGRLLRKMSLDELPELVNVVRGEMSLVGPRPLLMKYLARYTMEQLRRHEVRPGITGWAQLNGRNTLPWAERLAHDVWYVDNQSFWLDLRILIRTPWKAAVGAGVRPPGTEMRFEGAADQTDRDAPRGIGAPGRSPG